MSVQFEGEPAAAGAAAAAGQIRLPTSALVRAPGGKDSAVWVFDPTGSTVSMRSVIVAGADGNEIVIVSGLKDGEEIVAAGVHVLSPGQKVVRFASTAVR